MFRSFWFRTLLLAGLAALLPANTAHTAKVKVWHHHSAAHHEKAHFKHTVISNEGTLRLSRQLKPLAKIEAMHVWDVVEDKDGNLFVATGDEGKLFKVTPDGKVAVAYTCPDSQILCLALAADGSVYAGTGPTGLVVCVPPSGKTRVVAEDLDNYVWSLAIDDETKTVYAGTGPKGRIYQIPAQGKASVFYATKQDHILCLALGAKQTLYAGTDKGGLVYRIDAKGKGFVMYHCPQGEVRSLLVTADGVYAGTSAPTKRIAGGGSGSTTPTAPTGTHSGGGLTPASHKTKDGVKTPTKASTDPPASSGSSGSSESTKGSGAPAPTAPGSGENSLYRIAADGSVRELFREKAMLLCLLRQHGRVLVGTGMQGQLFEIDEATKERVEIARLDHGQIHSLCRRRDGSIVVGTGDPGKLYVLEDRFAAKGTVVSDVLDAKMISKWGSLTWQAERPLGTNVTVAVRTGNVAEPDETWSDWSAEQTDAQEAKVTTPSARFLQYRVTMTSDHPKKSPTVRGIAIRYMTTNHAPEVTSVEVPDLDAANQEQPKKLKLKWNATDPNEDELAYSLYVRKDGWKNWVMLEDNLEKKEFEWDTSAMPSGTYRLKVVASDRKDNAPEDALTAERISAPFPVSHIPPVVAVKVSGVDGDQAVIEATATDPHVRLTEASFAVNGKKWVPVFPIDGLFDSKSESFRFKTEALRPGTYVLVLRVRDAAGNLGSGDVVFTVEPRGEKK